MLRFWYSQQNYLSVFVLCQPASKVTQIITAGAFGSFGSFDTFATFATSDQVQVL